VEQTRKFTSVSLLRHRPYINYFLIKHKHTSKCWGQDLGEAVAGNSVWRQDAVLMQNRIGSDFCVLELLLIIIHRISMPAV
jgi:hypothetical protein